jgi:hypothetical protein
MLGLAGVIDMEDRVAGVAVRVVFPETVPELALIFELPAVTAVDSPLLSTVATAVLDDLQVTCVEISAVVPSEYMPEEVNCLLFPTGIVGLAGVMAMEDRAEGFTVRVVFPEILRKVEVMVAIPAATAVARPLLLTVATAALDDLQVTRVVIFWVVPSEYAPEAVNCFLFPTGTLGLAGVIDIEDRVAWFTLKVVLPEIRREVAVMVAAPAATAVPSPLPSTVATDGSEEVQVTCVVISLVVPSEYVPKAINWSAISTGTLGLPGVTDMERSSPVVPPELVLDEPESVPVPPPHPTEIRKGTTRRRENNSFAFIRHPP